MYCFSRTVSYLYLELGLDARLAFTDIASVAATTAISAMSITSAALPLTPTPLPHVVRHLRGQLLLQMLFPWFLWLDASLFFG